MENEIVSINKNISPIGSIDKWFHGKTPRLDKVEVAYRNIHQDPLYDGAKIEVVRWGSEVQVSQEISEDVYTELMGTRVELSLRKISGESLGLVEQRLLDSLNAMLSQRLKAKHDKEESSLLKKMSNELSDILKSLNK